MSEKFNIYSKIFIRDVENFVRHLCVLVLRHQMRVSNYFVNSFYSVEKSPMARKFPNLATLLVNMSATSQSRLNGLLGQTSSYEMFLITTFLYKARIYFISK